jgi:hypothetical protein
MKKLNFLKMFKKKSHSLLYPNGMPVLSSEATGVEGSSSTNIEFPARKRRTSHDEKIVAKQRTFLIDVEETKSAFYFFNERSCMALHSNQTIKKDEFFNKKTRMAIVKSQSMTAVLNLLSLEPLILAGTENSNSGVTT